MESNEFEPEKVWGLSQLEVDELRNEAVEKFKTTRHTWRKKGFWLVCKTCDNHHAIWIGDKEMTGEKQDGTPILVDRGKVQS